MFLGALPSNQLECQKLAFFPFPSVTIVEALNRSISVLSQGVSKFAHGRSSRFHLNHSQRNLKARAKRSSSRTPSPPKYFGVQTVGQLTRQWPPLTLSGSSHFHKKLLLVLLICLSIHFCIGNTVKWYMGCAVSTLLTNVSLPAMDIIFLFHPGMRLPILSNSG